MVALKIETRAATLNGLIASKPYIKGPVSVL